MLDLVLKAKWFDMIESGEKKEEYRDVKQFWWKRIFTSYYPNLDILSNGGYNGKHSTVRLRRGYGKNAPSMVWKLGHVGIGFAKPEWAEGHMGRMIVLPLHKRLA
jgi:hypothetical protein